MMANPDTRHKFGNRWQKGRSLSFFFESLQRPEQCLPFAFKSGFVLATHWSDSDQLVAKWNSSTSPQDVMSDMKHLSMSRLRSHKLAFSVSGMSKMKLFLPPLAGFWWVFTEWYACCKKSPTDQRNDVPSSCEPAVSWSCEEATATNTNGQLPVCWMPSHHMSHTHTHPHNEWQKVKEEDSWAHSLQICPFCSFASTRWTKNHWSCFLPEYALCITHVDAVWSGQLQMVFCEIISAMHDVLSHIASSYQSNTFMLKFWPWLNSTLSFVLILGMPHLFQHCANFVARTNFAKSSFSTWDTSRN